MAVSIPRVLSYHTRTVWLSWFVHSPSVWKTAKTKRFNSILPAKPQTRASPFSATCREKGCHRDYLPWVVLSKLPQQADSKHPTGWLSSWNFTYRLGIDQTQNCNFSNPMLLVQYWHVTFVHLHWKRVLWGGWSGCGWKKLENSVKMVLSGIICCNWCHLHALYVIKSMIPVLTYPWWYGWDVTSENTDC